MASSFWICSASYNTLPQRWLSSSPISYYIPLGALNIITKRSDQILVFLPMRWIRSVLSVIVNVLPAFADVLEIWWNVTYVQNVNPDGLFDRRAIGVNGTWPPPPISVNSLDSLLVHVTNDLDIPTSLHHHGIFFNSTPWMDGTVAVAQCGIPPGKTFDYVVPINASEQRGTYWVHSHFNGQYVDGLRSPLIIHPVEETYQYDEEYSVILSDWYHQEHHVLLKKYISTANPGGAEPIPDSALIYFAQNATYLEPIKGTSPSSPVGFNENATITFVPGRNYRLRIINMSAFAEFFFWIDGHDIRIIEADGNDVHEMLTSVLQLAAAQRYSVLVAARNDTSSNWAIHANMDTTMFDGVPKTLKPNITSSITYSPNNPLENLGPVSQYTKFDDRSLVPVVSIPQLPVTRTIELEVTFATMTDGTNRGMLNGIVHNPSLVPAVLSELSLGTNATIQGAYGPTSFVLDHLDVVDIVLKNTDTSQHPFHLHGHTFQIVNRALQFNTTDPTLNPPLVEGQTNPMRRDTVIVPAGGSVTLRFIADNPGAWFFHCHMEWHLEAGLAIQFIEAPLALQERSVGKVPSFIYDQCAVMGQPSSGNAAGHASATDLSGLPLGPYRQTLGWMPRGIWAMTGCVVTAVVGMLNVSWYSLGGNITEEEMEAEAISSIEEKAKRGRFFGLFSSPA